ncbi:hypothetical protein HDU67_003183, partial [Dinochytrium kinnereticum]
MQDFFASAWSAIDALFKDLSDSEDDEEYYLSHSITASVPRMSQRRSSAIFERTSVPAAPSKTPSLFPTSTLPSMDNLFPWTAGSEERPPNHPNCPHRHPFGALTGDVVFIPGLYGSNLNNRETDAKGWITMEMVWNLVHADVALSPGLAYGQKDDHVPESIIESVGPLNICRDMIKEMKTLEACRGGDMHFHAFAYDWRRELQHSSE